MIKHMKYKIEFSKKAIRSLVKLPQRIKASILEKLDDLSIDPYAKNNNVKKLQGMEDSYRLRVGDYRVVYRILDEKVVIEVVTIGHRQEVYK
ncbi:type II toxin-antitoxin system RelE/ParE family toxin [Candidatus Babeliales bacterium]|nr:type II toxin-antitoxin system RelE/ParE family toxin [Candidatus Babeliales bacterium]